MLAIKDIMTKDVIAVQADTFIYEALDLLVKNKISGVPVINDEERVVGILSEKDVLRILIDSRLGTKSTVEDYMSRGAICFHEDDEAVQLCKFFLKSHIRRVPVVKDDKLVGIVSRADIIPLILEAKQKISNYRYA